MNIQTNAKELFLNSLDASQRKFFLSKVHCNNIDELLEYKITVTQYKLYEAWRDAAKKAVPEVQQPRRIPEHPEFLNAPDFDPRKAETVKIIIHTGRYGVLDTFFADQSKYQQEYLTWKRAYLAQEEADLNKAEIELASVSIAGISGLTEKDSRTTRRGRSPTRKLPAVVVTKSNRESKQISSFFEAHNVPIKVNNSVKDSDDGFKALQIDLLGQKEWNRRFPKSTIVIYTDGSCFGSASSGAGVYHGPLHELNRAYNLSGCEHNSAFAEIGASILALNDLQTWKHYKNEKVVLRTDFLPMVQAIQNKYSVANGRFPSFYDLLRETCAGFPNGVEFQHVYAHDSSDIDPGNAAADEFARQAATCELSRKKAKFRGKSVARDRSQVRGRAASRSNCVQHIRSHSAYILADHIRTPIR